MAQNKLDATTRVAGSGSPVNDINLVLPAINQLVDDIPAIGVKTLLDIRGGVAVAGDNLAKLYALYQTLNDVLNSTTPDADTIINTLSEIKAFLATVPEGATYVQAMLAKLDVGAVINTLTETSSGKALDARQGKVLKDALDALTTIVNTPLNVNIDTNTLTSNVDGSLTLDLVKEAARILSAVQASAYAVTLDVRNIAGDHTVLLQAAINEARDSQRPLFGRGELRISDTVKIYPAAGQSVIYLDITWRGVATWTGVSGTSTVPKIMFDCVGWRGSRMSGLKVVIPNGVSNVVVHNLDTAGANGSDPARSSTSNILYFACDVVTNNGVDNVCWRLGKVSGGGADISCIKWDTCYLYGCDAGGGGDDGYLQAQGWGIQICGTNTLTNVTTNCTFGYLKYGIKTIDNGNADFTVDTATIFSHCYQDVEFNAAQQVRMRNTRHEQGRQVLNIGDGAASPTIIIDGMQIDNYVGLDNGGGQVIYMGRPGQLSINGVNAHSSRTGQAGVGFAPNFIRVTSFSTTNANKRKGSLSITNCAIAAWGGTFYEIEKDDTDADRFRVFIRNVSKLDLTANALPIAEFPNVN